MSSAQGIPSIDGEPGTRVYRITKDSLAKYTGSMVQDEPSICHEALVMETVWTRTTIPIPRLIRVIDIGESDHLAIMEYIPGKQLNHAWPTLSLRAKLRIAWTLRSYVRQLRKIRGVRPGPPGDGVLLCDGHVFGYTPKGPFADQAALASYFRKFLACYFPRPSSYDPFDLIKPLVLTHFDLNMRNILLGDDGQVWIIDWGWSGYYPEWFEFLSMTQANCEKTPAFWQRCIPFITDPFFLQERWMNAVP